MSRCFPYPPPGYVRNPVAVAEVETTTKLQKEREKAEKKKEKRNDKKALQKGGGEASKHSKRSHKKRKHEEIHIAGQECKKASKESVEQLEKSGLSEEHGAPCFIQRVHGSPESSQDSSKRRKVVLPSPSQNRNGNILRIKIRRDQDAPAAMLENSKVLEQSPVQQMGPGSSVSSKQNAIQPHSSKVMVKSAAALPQSIKNGPQPVLKQVNVQRPAEVLQRVDPPTTAKVLQKVDRLTTAKVMQKIDPQLSVNVAIGRLDPPSAKVMESAVPSPAKLTRRVVPPPAKAAQSVDLPPAKVLQSVDPPLPSKVLRRDDPPSSETVLRKETSAIAFCQPDEQQPPLLQKSRVPVETPVIKQQQTNSLPKEEPCFSGRNTEAAAVPEVKRSKSDRKKSRKSEKKERKFGDLFVTWNPPSFEMENTVDLDDHDWLLGGAMKPDASMNICTASDGLVPFQSMEQQFSLQPRAIHLPALHVYQLPYVVPF